MTRTGWYERMQVSEKMGYRCNGRNQVDKRCVTDLKPNLPGSDVAGFDTTWQKRQSVKGDVANCFCSPNQWWHESVGSLKTLKASAAWLICFAWGLPRDAVCTAAGGRRQVAVPRYSPEAVLRQEALPSSWQGLLNIAIITHLFYKLVFSVIFPPLVLVRSCMSRVSCCLAQEGWTIPAQSRRNMQGYAEVVQGTTLDIIVLQSACPRCLRHQSQGEL